MASFEEAARIVAEANAAISSFVMVEIDAGLTYCRLAHGPLGGEDCERALHRAKHAYRVALNAIGNLRVSNAEFERITARLRELESELDHPV